MDQILQGLFVSNHPDILKEKILQKILKSPKTAQDTVPVLNLAVKWSLDGETAFQCTSGVRLYENWARDNEEIFQKYFNKVLMNDILINSHQNPTAAIVIIEKSLQILKGTECYASLVKYFQQLITIFLKQNSNLQCLAIIFSLLMKQPKCVPVYQRYDFCCVIIDILYVTRTPKQGVNFLQEVKTINTAGQILFQLWENCTPNNSNDDTKKNSVHYLFSLISQPFDSPAVCLGTLSQIPVKSVEEIIDLINIDVINKPRISNTIYQILHWLDWPFSQRVHIWIIGIFEKLAAAGFDEVLKEIAQEAIVFIVNMLKPIASRESAAKILVHIYTKIQLSPDSTSHMIMSLVDIIPILAEEKSSTGLACIEILLANMELEIYWHSKEPFIKYRQTCFSIKELQLNKVKPLAALCNTSNCRNFTVPPLEIKKALTRKTGLCNVKNSCYMNSAIQVLFMLDNFRQEVLGMPVPPGGIISKLQEVFSYLLSSQRPSFYPSEFYCNANPSWFAKYEQQDCAEFLSHLLNAFDEEEKKNSTKTESLSDKNKGEITKCEIVDSKSRTLIDRNFFGKLRNSTRCLKCQTETKYEERFSFLLLALPHDDDEEEEVKEEKNINDKLDIRDLIQNYFTVEELKVSNQFKCPNCDDYRDGIRQVFLIDAPEYLNLTLSRFSYNKKNKKRSKIMAYVNYPKELCLKCFTTNDESLVVEEDINYVLCSVVIHSGYNSDSGHCILLSRHSCLINEHYTNLNNLLKDNWYIFNDESVTETKYNFSDTLKSSKSDTPYFFIYRRVTKELLDSGELCCNLEELLEKSVIPERFQKEISKDNERYFKEKLSQVKDEDSTKKKKDDFDYDGSGNSGGTNAFGHLDIFGSKFIY
ncbi:ubiquitin carboxyl-terminal hydrolase 38-like [Octopus sinensis]|uniref:Ubiquitin carboxyl-terminal hydrolase 38-like n=1 Tax=Octopus sinensis TaxID=2607531 RepID=A0A6P7SIU8_9MOLL|nr:ubiquitin carboxyl-terminal hydrolase 38-like [Octopus sinensis]